MVCLPGPNEPVHQTDSASAEDGIRLWELAAAPIGGALSVCAFFAYIAGAICLFTLLAWPGALFVAGLVLTTPIAYRSLLLRNPGVWRKFFAPTEVTRASYLRLLFVAFVLMALTILFFTDDRSCKRLVLIYGPCVSATMGLVLAVWFVIRRSCTD